ncbi:MAG: PLDc_N domain-containing protein [Clostridiaceae bacterium]|nr:PLDc_N domain-containing protein [Clostridiaceae bacterium]
MAGIDIKLIIPILILELVLKTFGFVDLARTEKERIRGGSKLLWVALILIVNTFGTIIYFIVGKKNLDK